MNFIKRIIYFLKKIYPFYLLLLAVSPSIVSIFTDYELFNYKYLLINLIWLSFLSGIAYILKSKIIYKLVTVIFFVFGLLEIIHWLILQGPITLTSLVVLSNTNTMEANEFISTKVNFSFLVLIPYLLIFVLAIKNPPEFKSDKTIKYVYYTLIILSMVYFTNNLINKRFIRKASPQIINVTASFIKNQNVYKKLLKDSKAKNINAIAEFKGKQTFVLIIGESCSRNHMSLYGYKRNTNPELNNRKDIIHYTDVVSPKSNTIGSVMAMLSNTSLDNNIKLSKRIDVFDIFSSAGFKTYWLSNQIPFGVWENRLTLFAKKADKLIFVNKSANTSKEATLSKSYDERLFEPFDEILKENHTRKLIIIQLMGSHLKYENRYPKEYKKFKSNDKKEEIIANYDNSILYNDFIVDSILNICKSIDNQENIISAIYTSDHGENVYDELDKTGHDFAGDLPKSNVEIPFIVFLNQNYINTFNEGYNTIKNNANKAFVTDDLFHSLIDISKIDTEVFDNSRSVFNKNFNHKRKRILIDGKDYDKK